MRNDLSRFVGAVFRMVGVALLCSAIAKGEVVEKPNILFLLADDTVDREMPMM